MKTVTGILSGLAGCKGLACQLLAAQCFVAQNCGADSDPLLQMISGGRLRNVV